MLRTRRRRRVRGGDCGCNGGNSPLSKLFSMSGGRKNKSVRRRRRRQYGGTVGFQESGLPNNTIPLNQGTFGANSDVQRMAISSRMNGGRRKKTARKFRGGGLGMFGTGFQDPLGGGGPNILSGFGTSGGSGYSAQIMTGSTVGGNPGGLFNYAGLKPMV
jgi:hypothetical protein